jgi:hypothetical protein
MIRFARLLPKIRKRTDHDLTRSGLPRPKVLAAVVRLLETTLIQVGNDEYARTNGSYGLTTMKDRHAEVQGAWLRFKFRGKSGVDHEIDIRDRRLARIVARCQDLPGQELFAYVDDDGQVRDVGSEDVNDYLREITGQDFTAKDFRTWAGTVLAALGAAGVPGVRLEGAGEEERGRRDRSRRRAARQHSKRLPQVLRPSSDPGRLPRRDDARLLAEEVPARARRGDRRAPAGKAILAMLENRLAREVEQRSA